MVYIKKDNMKVPAVLRPFIRLGFVYDEEKVSGVNVRGDCIFCGKVDKFYIRIEDGIGSDGKEKKAGMWDCKSCQKLGNVYSFMKFWYDFWLEERKNYSKQFIELSLDRGVPAKTLKDAGIVYDNDQFAIPVRNATGTINNFRFYNFFGKIPRGKKKHQLYGMPELDSQLYGMDSLFQGVARGIQKVYICYSADTEILTEEGWIKFPTLKNQKVAQYAENTQNITFVKPLAKQILPYSKKMVNIKGNSCDLLVTPEHRVLIKETDGIRTIRADQVKSGMVLPVSGEYRGKGYSPSNNEVKLLVAYAADGHKERGNRRAWAFKKERKVSRLIEILESLEIPYKFGGLSAKGYTQIVVMAYDAPILDRIMPTKQITSDFIHWSVEARETLINELRFWDGDTVSKYTHRVFSADKVQVDAISSICVTTGYSCNIREDTRKSSINYILNISPRKYRNVTSVTTQRNITNKVYCVTVPTGTVVVRRNGKIVICRNCEGEWDTIALEYLLSKESVEAIVVGTPGANTWKASWNKCFSGKEVTICYDVGSEGEKGTEKVYHNLKDIVSKSSPIKYINWSKKGDLPDGYDVRDHIKQGGTYEQFIQLEEKYTSIPVKEEQKQTEIENTPTLQEVQQSKSLSAKRPTFEKVLKAYRKYLFMDKDMENGLRIMFATCLTVGIKGDPLWVHTIGPPGSGKTALLMSLSKVKIVVSKSSITRNVLVSGMNVHPDPSLIPRLNGKLFVFKDFTELLGMRSDDKEFIFSTLRGVYDGTLEKDHGNGTQRDFKSHFNMLTGVTQKIFTENRSIMGERFLLYHMVKGTDYDSRNPVMAAIDSVGSEVPIHEELVGIAAEYLDVRVSKEDIPVIPQHYKEKIYSLACLTSLLRATVERLSKVDRKLMLRPQQEMPTRIAKQLTKLLMGLSLLNTPIQYTQEDIALVTRVALDSCVAFNLETVSSLIQKPGQTLVDLAIDSNIPHSTLRDHIEDLVELGVIRYVAGETTSDFQGRGRKPHTYYVTPKMEKIWKDASLERKDGEVYMKLKSLFQRNVTQSTQSQKVKVKRK